MLSGGSIVSFPHHCCTGIVIIACCRLNCNNTASRIANHVYTHTGCPAHRINWDHLATCSCGYTLFTTGHVRACARGDNSIGNYGQLSDLSWLSDWFWPFDRFLAVWLVLATQTEGEHLITSLSLSLAWHDREHTDRDKYLYTDFQHCFSHYRLKRT